MILIREATHLDLGDIRATHLCAFPEGEGEMVAALALNLLGEQTNPKTLSLVAEADGEVIGHIAFSPVTVENNTRCKGYILAPLGVKPQHQKRRVGSRLIKSGMDQLTKMGVNILFVYGDPSYYGKFGFHADTASNYSPPYALQYPFGWQAIVLNKGAVTGSAAKISCVDPLNHAELW